MSCVQNEIVWPGSLLLWTWPNCAMRHLDPGSGPERVGLEDIAVVLSLNLDVTQGDKEKQPDLGGGHCRLLPLSRNSEGGCDQRFLRGDVL